MSCSLLRNLGVKGSLLHWFSDYLSGGQQRVVDDGATSSPCLVTSAVPQGSILGPLLFSCFMNSITEVPLSPGVKLVLYAHDILLLNCSQDALDLQQDIHSISKWAGLPLIL